MRVLQRMENFTGGSLYPQYQTPRLSNTFIILSIRRCEKPICTQTYNFTN